MRGVGRMGRMGRVGGVGDVWLMRWVGTVGLEMWGWERAQRVDYVRAKGTATHGNAKVRTGTRTQRGDISY